MVKQYLEKTRDEFYDSKYALIEKLTAAENHFKENIKIIQMLEGKSDESFEAFTPREINSSLVFSKYFLTIITELLFV